MMSDLVGRMRITEAAKQLARSERGMNILIMLDEKFSNLQSLDAQNQNAVLTLIRGIYEYPAHTREEIQERLAPE